MKLNIFILTIFGLFLFTFCSLGSKNNHNRKMKYVPSDMTLFVPEPKDSIKPFYISNHLTTNMEYFTFLFWMYTVCERDQSKYYLEYLPENEEALFKLFHKDYSNKPVLGISKKQIIAYCQWKTAVLNEYILVKQKFTNKKIKIPNNLEGKFGLETFVLHGSYYWYLDNLTRFNWRVEDSLIYDNLFIWRSSYLYPNYRLPSKNELIYFQNNQKKINTSNIKIDESILNIYKVLEKKWNYRLKHNVLSDKMDFLIDLKVNGRGKKKKRRFDHDEVCELVFNDSNHSNISFFQKLKISKIKNCTEIDRFGNLYTKCNLFLIDEENSRPVFINYGEYLKCFDNVMSINCNTSYSSYSGFRCVMFAPGY